MCGVGCGWTYWARSRRERLGVEAMRRRTSAIEDEKYSQYGMFITADAARSWGAEHCICAVHTVDAIEKSDGAIMA